MAAQDSREAFPITEHWSTPCTHNLAGDKDKAMPGIGKYNSAVPTTVVTVMKAKVEDAHDVLST